MKKQLLALALLGASAAASAHFQLVYTPEVRLDEAAVVPVKLAFWHPMENGHAMNMQTPNQFYYVHKGQQHDLLPALRPIVFQGKENAAAGFEADVNVRRNGDYVFVLQPKPYYEKSEDIYIQQITKSFVNKGDMPDSWHQPLGLPAEIVPFNKPTNVLVGSTFTGQVLADGKPVAGVEIEIEYMPAEPDVKINAPSSGKSASAKGGAIVAVSDSNGMFTFGIPKAGFWGFAALGAGNTKTYQGKELNQDAVIWIRADELEIQ